MALVGGLGIPFGDQAAWQGHMNGRDQGLGCVEVDDGRLHAHAEGCALHALRAAVIDETGKVGGRGERSPLFRAAIGGSDGGEGSPFVDGQSGGGRNGVCCEQRSEQSQGKNGFEKHGTLLVDDIDAGRGESVNCILMRIVGRDTVPT